jgi:ABC-type transport system involved in cytochrome c biogenesis permease subunit
MTCEFTQRELRAPVWYNGNVKSFQLASFFTVKHLFKKVSVKKAANFYCLLITADKKSIQEHPIYKKSEIKYFSRINELPKIFSEANKIEDKKQRERALSTFEKIRTFRELIHKKHLMAFDKTWKPLINFNINTPSDLKKALQNSYSAPKTNYIYENYIYEYRLIAFAFYILILAMLCFFIPTKNKLKIFYALSLSSFALQLIVIYFRILTTSRAPITNMYETVLLAGPLAMLLGLFFIKKNDLLYRFATFFCLATIGTAYFSSAMLDSEIKNLMPVLRDNFWLSTHVTTIMLGYSTLGISWALSNYVLIKKIFRSKIELEPIDHAMILALRFGTFFLFFGILLGAIWADYSWGRFWAWDPKETWSLIAFLIYMLVLHGVSAKIIKRKNIYPIVSLSFISILIAWFGVNFVLSTGLHTYGFSYGGTVFLISIILLQIAIVLKSHTKKEELIKEGK